MNIEQLLAAFQNAGNWLGRFNVRNYVEAYREYCSQFAPMYLEAIQEYGADELANALLDALEAGWKRQRIWNRSTARMDDKDILVRYFSPMLLDYSEQGGDHLAAAVRDGWNARFPKEAYQIAPYKQILGGFRNTFLGIDVPDRRGTKTEKKPKI